MRMLSNFNNAQGGGGAGIGGGSTDLLMVPSNIHSGVTQ